MPSFEPNQAQREIADAFSRNAQLLGRGSTLRRLSDAASKRFSEPRLGQLVAHIAGREAEFGRALVDEFRRGRFTVATALARSMLETCTWAAWPLATASETEQRARLIRLLLAGYRDAQHKGATIPPDAQRLLATTTGKAARTPPSFNDMLKQLDTLEAKTPGGTPFWVSHADHYNFASDYTHPTISGSFADLAGTPIEWLGVNALVRGHQYLALTGATCAVLAEVPDLQSKIEARYAEAVTTQHAELARVGV